MNSGVFYGDAARVLKTLPSGLVQCCVTSPPYWGLRDYSVEGQFGMEKTIDEYITRMVGVFREVKRVLRNDGVVIDKDRHYCDIAEARIAHVKRHGINWLNVRPGEKDERQGELF